MTRRWRGTAITTNHVGVRASEQNLIAREMCERQKMFGQLTMSGEHGVLDYRVIQRARVNEGF